MLEAVLQKIEDNSLRDSLMSSIHGYTNAAAQREYLRIALQRSPLVNQILSEFDQVDNSLIKEYDGYKPRDANGLMVGDDALSRTSQFRKYNPVVWVPNQGSFTGFQITV